MTDFLRITLPQSLRPDIESFKRPFVRGHIIEAYTAATENPDYATPTLSRWFRTHRSLGSKDRRRVSDAVYDIIRYGDFLRHAGFHSAEELLNGWLLLQQGERFPHLVNQDPVQDLSIALGLPKWMISDWHQQLGLDSCAQLVETLSERASVQVRSYPHKSNREALQKKLSEEGISSTTIPNTTYGLTLTQRCNIQASQAFRTGLLEVQDAASQRLCEVLAPSLNNDILDYCAGAGGKSLLLASLGVKVFINDPRDKALQQAHSRAQRTGIKLYEGRPKQIDTVLVDAPCSGTGRLRREPALRWRYPTDPKQFDWTAQQAQIVSEAAQHVAPGGRLIYATCSMLSCENQPSIRGWQTLEQTQLWPHIDGCDGFSWTILQRPTNV